MFKLTTLRVFVGSPSDVKEDRDIAVGVLKRIAETPAFRGRVAIQVFTYDDLNAPTAMPANVNPEFGIVKYGSRPSDHHFTIIILWSRMGTRLPASVKTPDGRTFDSGTEWEYEDARRAGKDVFVYHRADPPPPATQVPGDEQEQLRKLQRFVSTFRNADGSLAGFVHEFRRPPGLEETLNKDMQNVVRVCVERAENIRARLRMAAVAALILVVASVGTAKVIERNETLPRIVFRQAKGCKFASNADRTTGYLWVDYEITNAPEMHPYLALYKEKPASGTPLVRRELQSLTNQGWVDFSMRSEPRFWGRIEVQGVRGGTTSSEVIEIECPPPKERED